MEVRSSCCVSWSTRNPFLRKAENKEPGKKDCTVSRTVQSGLKIGPIFLFLVYQVQLSLSTQHLLLSSIFFLSFCHLFYCFPFQQACNNMAELGWFGVDICIHMIINTKRHPSILVVLT